MADGDLPDPQPQPVDEERNRELQHIASDAVLRGHPSGDERCGNCLYFADEGRDISYCWHPKLRLLVGDDWWCQWWEARQG